MLAIAANPFIDFNQSGKGIPCLITGLVSAW
jgi:hypothetical protein